MPIGKFRPHHLTLKKLLRHGWPYIFTWLLLSFSFYSFTSVIRETFRLMSQRDGDILIMTATEHYFYNFVFAGLSCVACWGMVMDTYCKSNMIVIRRFEVKRYLITNEQTGLTWYYLYWLFALGVPFGTLGMGISIYKVFTFYPSYTFLFVALIIVLFFYQWTTIRLVLRKSGFKWMFVSFGVILIVSFIFSRINFINYKTINNQSIFYKYKIDVPYSAEARVMSAPRTDLFVGTPICNPTDIMPIVVLSSKMEIPLTEVSDYIREVDDYFSEIGDESFIVLNIDDDVKVRYLKQLTSEISHTQNRIFYYRVSRDDDWKVKVLNNGVRSYCQDLKNKADSIRAGFPVRRPTVLNCRQRVSLEDFNEHTPVIRISLVMNRYFLNDNPISLEDLSAFLYNLLLEDECPGLVEFHSDDNSDFKHYIDVWGAIFKAYNDRREELIQARFGISYRSLDIRHHNYEIREYLREVCPINLIEWTDDERVIIDYVRSIALKSNH